MNPNIQKHIGSILLAIAGIGTELLNEPETAAESTTDKPKGGRPRKTAEPVTTASVEPTSSSAPAEPEKTAVTGALTMDELRTLILPHVQGGKGPEVKKITDAHLPADRQGQGIKALSEFPEKHASFKRDIEALAY